MTKEQLLEVVEKMSERDIEKVGSILMKNEDEHLQNQETNNSEEQDNAYFDSNENQQPYYEDETMSKASRYTRSVYGGAAKSEISRISNKTYIKHLQDELEEERLARKKLEEQLEELKKLSSEISSHLGLAKK